MNERVSRASFLLANFGNANLCIHDDGRPFQVNYSLLKHVAHSFVGRARAAECNGCVELKTPVRLRFAKNAAKKGGRRETRIHLKSLFARLPPVRLSVRLPAASFKGAPNPSFPAAALESAVNRCVGSYLQIPPGIFRS